MNAQCNAPISDRFSSLCARVFYRRSAILKNRRGEGPGDEVANSHLYVTPVVRILSQCASTVEASRDHETKCSGWCDAIKNKSRNHSIN